MEFACHTWAFHDQSLTEALGNIARMGFRYVDIVGGPHLDVTRAAQYPQEMAAEIRAQLATFNLQLSDVGLMLLRISLADAEKRRTHITLFKALLPFLLALEVPGLTLSPGLVQPGDETAFDRAADALAEMVAAAQTATPHLRVSFEPHLDSVAQSPAAARQLLNRIDGLSLTLDWAQMVCQNVPHREIVGLIPHARHIQIRQAARNQLQTPFDRGRIDVARVIRALKDAQYTGVVSVEYLQIKNWHGVVAVNSLVECARMRDALRDARDAGN